MLHGPSISNAQDSILLMLGKAGEVVLSILAFKGTELFHGRIFQTHRRGIVTGNNRSGGLAM